MMEVEHDESNSQHHLQTTQRSNNRCFFLRIKELSKHNKNENEKTDKRCQLQVLKGDLTSPNNSTSL